jgi:microcystin-dependent protein
MIKVFFLLSIIFAASVVHAQNIGIGTNTPTEKLDVAGNIKSTGLKLTTGAANYDFLMQVNTNGQVGAKKGYGALALHYIICTDGNFPNVNPPTAVSPFLAEIKLFAGNYAPVGWAFCEGQLLPIVSNQSLFAVMGTTYGGNGTTNFALPDLRGAVPVHTGTSPAGYSWIWAQRTY